MKEENYTKMGVLPQPDAPKRSGNSCLSCWCWFLQLAVWASLGVAIFLFISNKEWTMFIPFGVCYILFIISEFCSPTCDYLSHQNENDAIYKVMGNLFNTAPVITWSVVCYHYVTHHYTTRDKHGHVHHHTRRVRVNSYSGHKNMDYYSFRDVSGTFLLDIDQATLKNKAYIKLHLSKTITFADAITYADYKYQKDSYYNANRGRDKYMDFTETQTIPGLQKYNLVKLGDYEPCCFGLPSYVIWTIIPLCQFYKLYVQHFCVYQPFTIRKTISTRYNLISQDFCQQYQAAAPCLNLGPQTYNYSVEEAGCVYESAKLNMPTEEELRNAEQFQNKIGQDISISSADMVAKPSEGEEAKDEDDAPGLAEINNHGYSSTNINNTNNVLLELDNNNNQGTNTNNVVLAVNNNNTNSGNVESKV